VPSTPGKKALAMEAFAKVNSPFIMKFRPGLELAGFALGQALRQLPTIIADNGGFDSSELITQLRAAHARYDTSAPAGSDGISLPGGTWRLRIFMLNPVGSLFRTRTRGQATYGLDMINGGIADMKELGIRESFKSKLQV
jgi:T-complex protein 1 subunit beta